MRDYTNSEMKNLIEEHIHSSRDRAILSMCYIDGYTYEKIAEEVDLTSRQISTIISKGTLVLEKFLV